MLSPSVIQRATVLVGIDTPTSPFSCASAGSAKVDNPSASAVMDAVSFTVFSLLDVGSEGQCGGPIPMRGGHIWVAAGLGVGGRSNMVFAAPGKGLVLPGPSLRGWFFSNPHTIDAICFQF